VVMVLTRGMKKARSRKKRQLTLQSVTRTARSPAKMDKAAAMVTACAPM
jgi:hypothetical protein